VNLSQIEVNPLVQRFAPEFFGPFGDERIGNVFVFLHAEVVLALNDVFVGLRVFVLVTLEVEFVQPGQAHHLEVDLLFVFGALQHGVLTEQLYLVVSDLVEHD